MKYEFIKTYRSEFTVKKMCRVLNVRRSSFYGWVKRTPSQREVKNRILLAEIVKIHDKYEQTYGSPRMRAELNSQGHKCGISRVTNLMNKHNIVAKTTKKFKVTTDSNHAQPVAPNLLEQQFTAKEPNVIWIADITYIWTREGWLYLAAVLDVYSRKIVGWSMSNRITKELVIDALNQAYWKRKPTEGLIFHSDRGSQYASIDFRQLLTRYKMRQSMSGKGNCYDNAMMESFFHTLKTERVYWRSYQTREQAMQCIFEYIEMFYNRERRHSGISYNSPSDYERVFMLRCA
jgi:putative transposase